MHDIPVFAAERNDGLEKLVRTTSSVVYAAQIQSEKEPFAIGEPVLARLKQIAGRAKATNEGQFDLHYLKTILASVGWNLNEDVFDREETWAARHTPEDKPFNYEHVGTDIIGHITSCWAVDAEGKELDDNLVVDDVPSKFHIATGAVLYRCWEDKAAQERMEKIIAEIGEGKWFVSMEALFPNFDYAVVRSDGSAHVVKRSEKTAYLTKHLKAYGGTGKYEGMKVGRLLRNFVFSGKGLVRKPANPESIISTASEAFVPAKATFDKEFFEIPKAVGYSEVTDSESAQEKKVMATELELIQKQLADKSAENDTLKAQLRDSDVKKVQADLDKANADVKAKAEQIKLADEAKAKLEADLKAANEQLATAKKNADEAEKVHKATAEELNAIKAEKKKLVRVNLAKSILKVDEKDDKAVKAALNLVDTFDHLADDKFEANIKAVAEAWVTNNPAPGNTSFPAGGAKSPPKATSAPTAPKATSAPSGNGAKGSENDPAEGNANTDALESAEATVDASLAAAADSEAAKVDKVSKDILAYFDVKTDK